MSVRSGVEMTPRITVPSMVGARSFRWVVFALTFGLLLSDYMSRQVVAAVFPMLKSEWGLTDTKLATLNSVVSLSVAVLAVPLSIIGDRFGRARAVVVMALVWSAATLASGFAASYGHLLLSRVVVGVGEAAYGSIGLAVLLTVFPASKRSTLTGTFLAGSSIGSVIGVALGGAFAQHFGWRAAFIALGVAGVVLTGFYALAVSDRKLEANAHPAQNDESAAESAGSKAKFRTLVSTPAVIAAYLASGLQLLLPGAMYAWLPSYFNRVYHLETARASSAAAGVITVIAVGMIVTGMITDKVCAGQPERKWIVSLVYVVISGVALMAGFSMPLGTMQVVVLCIGAFFCAGVAGPAGALVANLTVPSIRATAFATLSLANNLLGLASGPFIVGILADRMGLASALKVIPLVTLLVIGALLWGRATYRTSLEKVGTKIGATA